MSERNFRSMLEAKWAEGKFVCVGLDSEFEKIPESIKKEVHPCKGLSADIMIAFNKAIVDATCDLVCAYKPNAAFYEAEGEEGFIALRETIGHINKTAPDVPVILDAKRADIGKTNKGYVKMAFSFFEADAITVHPYLGREALQPFLDQKDKGVIVLCRTSNPGAGEFQDAMIDPQWIKQQHDGAFEHFDLGSTGRCIPLYQYVAYRVAYKWNANNNCHLVIGATYPTQATVVREVVNDVPFLIPGIGTQGGDIEATVMACRDSRGWGMIINSSSGIIFASNGDDFAEAARREALKLHDLINQYRKGGDA